MPPTTIVLLHKPPPNPMAVLFPPPSQLYTTATINAAPPCMASSTPVATHVNPKPPPTLSRIVATLLLPLPLPSTSDKPPSTLATFVFHPHLRRPEGSHRTHDRSIPPASPSCTVTSRPLLVDDLLTPDPPSTVPVPSMPPDNGQPRAVSHGRAMIVPLNHPGAAPRSIRHHRRPPPVPATSPTTTFSDEASLPCLCHVVSMPSVLRCRADTSIRHAPVLCQAPHHAGLLPSNKASKFLKLVCTLIRAAYFLE